MQFTNGTFWYKCKLPAAGAKHVTPAAATQGSTYRNDLQCSQRHKTWLECVKEGESEQ